MAKDIKQAINKDTVRVRLIYKALRQPSSYTLTKKWWDFLVTQINLTSDDENKTDRFLIKESVTTWCISWSEIAAIDYMVEGEDSVEWANIYGDPKIFKHDKDAAEDHSVFFSRDTIWDTCFDVNTNFNEGIKVHLQVTQDVIEALGSYWHDYTKNNIGTPQIKVYDVNDYPHSFDLSKVDALAYSVANGPGTAWGDRIVKAGPLASKDKLFEAKVSVLKDAEAELVPAFTLEDTIGAISLSTPLNRERVASMLDDRIATGLSLPEAAESVIKFADRFYGGPTEGDNDSKDEDACEAGPEPEKNLNVEIGISIGNGKTITRTIKASKYTCDEFEKELHGTSLQTGLARIKSHDGVKTLTVQRKHIVFIEKRWL